MRQGIEARDYVATPARKVAFLGLGVMGYPMAGHLVAAGHTVTVYNRTTSKAQAFASEFSAQQGATPAAAVEGADIVLSCVGNDDDLRAVVLGDSGALAGMKPGAILVDHTTASAQVARELHAAAQDRGLQFVDAPVSGGDTGARKGSLTIMCGGDPSAFDRVQPVISAYASAVTLMGPSGSGQLTKMVNQICVAGAIQGVAEGIAFAQHAGLDIELLLQVISKGAAQSWQLENRGPTMAQDQFDFGFAVDWIRKDLGLVLAEGSRNGSRLPVTALLDQFYADVQVMGGGRWDSSSLIKRLK